MRKPRLILITTGLLLLGLVTAWGNEPGAAGWMSTLSAYWTNPVYASDSFMVERGLSSRLDLWRNGYFNLFFCHYWFGYVSWLAIPLALYFAMTWRRRQRWERALATVWLLAFITIAVKGYYNERYALTIFPLTIAGILWLSWERTRRRGRLALVLLYLIMIASSFYRCAHAWRSHFVEKVWLAQWVSIPPKILTFFEENDPAQGLVLVCNEPFFYYYTSWKGLDYDHPFIHRLSREANPERALWLLRTKGVSYVLASHQIERQKISRLKHVFTILKSKGTLLEDDFGRRLYALPP